MIFNNQVFMEKKMNNKMKMKIMKKEKKYKFRTQKKIL